MKLIKLLSILLVTCLFTVGCEDYLERNPLSELSPGTFFATRGDMRTWTAGMYDAMQTTLEANHLEWGDLRSDNYGNTGYGDSRVYLNAIDASMGQYNWENLYRVIDRANVGIERFPTIPNLLPGDYNDFVGQCYGMRALMYFYAVRVWGDVPLVTESWNGDIDDMHLGRTDAEIVKEQILSDIDEAIARLSAEVSGQRKYYFNLGAARALKTDVHMWFHEYEEAIAASDYFVGHSGYALVSDAGKWKEMFTDPIGSTETIFNMHWSSDLSDGINSWAQRVGASNTNNTYKISSLIFNEFVDRLYSGAGADGRFWNSVDTLRLWIAGNEVPLSYNHYYLPMGSGTEKCIKYSEPSANENEEWVVLPTSNSFVQVPIYRLADVLLLRAEALNQIGQGDDALNIVNSLRARIGYFADANGEVDVNDKESIESLILKERQLEFMCEGKRWFDLMRTDKILEVMDPVMMQRQGDANVAETGFGDVSKAKFPIYFREFESNPALKGHQNPPYTEG